MFKLSLLLLLSMLLIPHAALADSQKTPQGTLTLYIKALEDGKTDSNLPLYSKATRAFMARHKRSAGMMKNEARTLRSCGKSRVVTDKESRAVLFFDKSKKACNPYFFVVEDRKWRLDFNTMKDVVRFGPGNQWWIDPRVPNPYSFAF